MCLDPRTKLLILALTSISVFMNGSLLVECIFVLAPGILLLCFKKWRSAFKNLLLFAVLLSVQLFAVPLLPVTAGGIVYMFAVYIRKLIPCFMLGNLLISTTKVSQFLAAVRRMRLPKGLTISMSITLRYFPTMKEEWLAIRDAMSLRGLSTSFIGFICHPAKTMEYIYVPMLVSASKISDEITQAAITRGIDHVQKRTCIEKIGFTLWDVFILLVYAGILALMILLPLKGGL